METASKFSGARIRQARHAAGMTQAALAVAAGTRERNIIRWENDQHSPRFEHVAAIAKATGKDIEFFVAEAESTDDDEESDPVLFGSAIQAMFDRAVDRAVERKLSTLEPGARVTAVLVYLFRPLLVVLVVVYVVSAVHRPGRIR
jgi:transcriptional regulator with XRE-family HTH domain